MAESGYPTEADLSHLPSDAKVLFSALADGLRKALSTTVPVRHYRNGRFLSMSFKAGHRTVAQLHPKGMNSAPQVWALIPTGAADTPDQGLFRTRRNSGPDYWRITPADLIIGLQVVTEAAHRAERHG